MRGIKNEIIKLRDEGKTYNEIKNILKCSKGTISYHCSKQPKIILYKILNIDTETIIKILELRKNKLRYDEIYSILDKKVSKEDIRIICNKNGLSYLNRLNENDIKNIKKLYDETKSIRKINKITGISREVIRKYINIEKKAKTISRSKSVVDWRKRKKIELIKYKGGKCERCGYNKCVDALGFHHIDPSNKDFTISGKSWSLERLKKECDKCILVCSNCHSEIHYEIKLTGTVLV